ncbi:MULTISPECIES: hypothetical protein [unclassified Clostridium]|uniref:hypothetical protein n=1 Tax=Clostridium sp. UMB9555A TaxID=3050593 RepID=UPI00254B0A0D|nr:MULTISPECIES: hypothetical protein [unclassified Clostridium]MDK7589889.1 hypothetical protein [Clostridium sp. UMB9555B]MDK7627717.1 hypothetical protein [Clostridium sp. UMB9555A]
MKKNSKILIIISVIIIAIVILFVGYKIKPVQKQSYEPISYDDYLIAEIEKVLVEKGTQEQSVSILLNIENISKGFQSGIYQFELVKNDEVNKTETKINPNKAKSKIKAKEILNTDDVFTYGDPILASTEIKIVVTYEIPLNDKLEGYSLSLHNTPVGNGLEPTLINLK